MTEYYTSKVKTRSPYLAIVKKYILKFLPIPSKYVLYYIFRCIIGYYISRYQRFLQFIFQSF